MKNKIILLTLSLLLLGCASLKYPNWERVAELKSAYKQHCKEVGSDKSIEYDQAWLKKRATIYGGNNFVMQPTKDNSFIAVYFYCSQEIPLYMQPSGSANIVAGTNPNFTKSDYEKSLLKCNYEVHKATFTNETPDPTRIYVPTTNPYLNQAQNHAINMDRHNKIMAEISAELKTSQLLQECLAIAGYKKSESLELKDFEAVEKHCPAKDDLVEGYCFIPSGK